MAGIKSLKGTLQYISSVHQFHSPIRFIRALMILVILPFYWSTDLTLNKKCTALVLKSTHYTICILLHIIQLLFAKLHDLHKLTAKLYSVTVSGAI